MKVLNFDLKILIFSALCLVFAEASGQGWINFYSNADDQDVQSIFRTADNGYAIIGFRTNSISSTPKDALFIKTDQFGKEHFQMTYGQGGQISEKLYAGTELKNGGFILVGEQYNNQNTGNTKYYIVKVQEDGTQEWVKTINQIGKDVPLIKVFELPSGNLMVIGENGNAIKLDAGGDILFQQPSIIDSSLIEANYTILDIEILSDNEYISLITMPTGTGGLLSEFVTRFDSAGMYAAHVQIPDSIGSTSNDLVIADNKSYLIAGKDEFGALVMKLNENGQLEWHKRVLNASNNNYFHCSIVNIQQMDNNKFMATTSCDPTGIRGDYIFVLDSIGNIVLQRDITNEFSLVNTGSLKLPYNEFVVAGKKPLDKSVGLMKMDSLGNAFVNALTGNAIFDENGDCFADTSESMIKQVIIKASSSVHDFYAVTDQLGNYFLPLDTGSYQVTLTYPNPYFDASSCANDTFTINFPATYDTITQDLFLFPEIYCPSLFVDISTPYLKKCQNSTYIIDYCNLGTAVAADAYVSVEFDAFTNVLGSSIPFNLPVNGNTYTFELGDVGFGQCGSFQVEVQLSCNSILGQTHCAEANIYPDTVCLPASALWDSSSLRVTAACFSNGDSVRFTIENIGIGDMDTMEQLVVIEEDIMVKDDMIQVAAGQSTSITVAATGSTFRAIAKQRPGHPFSNFATDFIEGCGNIWGITNSGVVGMFAEADGSPFVSIDCQQNVATTISNTLTVVPKGATVDNIIPVNQALEYQVKFQNLGTDTAGNVIIIDTLMDKLEMTSIVPGAASHPYTFELLGRNMIKFTFENINLPSYLQNERASHGYVKFKVSQQPDLDKGTIIKNNAAIYFDYQSPLLTSSVEGRIGLLVFEDTMVSGIDMLDNLELNVFPNPFRGQATVEVTGKRFEFLTLKIYDLSGNHMHSFSAQNTNKVQLTNLDLSTGIYLFTLDAGNDLIGRGKLTVY